VRKQEKENAKYFRRHDTTELAFASIPGACARARALIFRTSRRGVCFSPGRGIAGDIFETGLMLATGSRRARGFVSGTPGSVRLAPHGESRVCAKLMRSYRSEHARRIPPVVSQKRLPRDPPSSVIYPARDTLGNFRRRRQMPLSLSSTKVSTATLKDEYDIFLTKKIYQIKEIRNKI